jgi:serine/threonine protein kinase
MLARYKIAQELGRGGLGAVYAARDRTTGAAVALKRLDPELLKSDAGLAGRFVAQARSARHLRHPNIAAVHEAGEAAGTAYVATEMAEGENLRALLDAGPLPVARAIRIAHEIASGLAHAHLEGVVHGGLKPSNVIVLRSGGAKITDFAIAAGDPGYMSPEQKAGDPVDHRSDIFSLGALLYEMLTHRRPFDGGAATAPPPSEVNPLVPRALDAVVMSMLAAQPAARMPGVPILLRELARLEEGLGLSSEPAAPKAAPPKAEQRVPEPPKREPQMIDPNRIRDHAPMHEGPRFPPHGVTDRMFDDHRAIPQREWQERSSRSGPTLLPALALVLTVLGIGVSNIVDFRPFLDDWSGRIERGVASFRAGPGQAAPATVSRVPLPAAPQPVAEATPKESVAPPIAPPALPPVAPPQPVAAAPDPSPPPAEPPAPLPRAAEPPAPSPRVAERPARLPLTRSPVAPAAEKRAPAGTAKLILAVSPRGELYIDGEHHGTTPPTTTVDLEPGMYRVEVRSGSRKPFLTYVTVEAGEVRRIRHDFNAKPIRPPY